MIHFADTPVYRSFAVLGVVYWGLSNTDKKEKVVYATKSRPDMHTLHRLGDEVNLPTADFSYSNEWYTPRELICPDIAVPLRSWVDILVRVAEWLIRRRYIDKSYCPVQKGPKTTILNTRPTRPDGTPFRLYTKIGNLYVNKTNVQT